MAFKCKAKIILSTYQGKIYPRTDEATRTHNDPIFISEDSTEIHGDVTNEMWLLVESNALANLTGSILQEMGAKYQRKYQIHTN